MKQTPSPFVQRRTLRLGKPTDSSQDMVASLEAAPGSNPGLPALEQQHELCQAQSGGLQGGTTSVGRQEVRLVSPFPLPSQLLCAHKCVYVHAHAHTHPHTLIFIYTLRHIRALTCIFTYRQHVHMCAYLLSHAYTPTCMHTLVLSQPSHWFTLTHTYSNPIAM